MAVRTFMALALGEETVGGLAALQERLSAAGASVRWVAPENLHLTLKFLGDVEDADLPKVCEIAGRAAGQVEPFEFSVAGVSCVPPAGQPRMVWAGVAEATGRLERLAGLLEQACAEAGFKEELRRFQPHLTLGRVKGGRNAGRLRAAVAGCGDADFGEQPAAELIVFGSQLTPAGPIYSPMARVPLGGGGRGEKN